MGIALACGYVLTEFCNFPSLQLSLLNGFEMLPALPWLLARQFQSIILGQVGMSITIHDMMFGMSTTAG